MGTLTAHTEAYDRAGQRGKGNRSGERKLWWRYTQRGQVALTLADCVAEGEWNNGSYPLRITHRFGCPLLRTQPMAGEQDIQNHQRIESGHM